LGFRPAPRRAPPQPAWRDTSDEAIRERITAIFAQMSGFAAIEVEVREGVVSLDGSASNEA
jgi:hypothetical protein